MVGPPGMSDVSSVQVLLRWEVGGWRRRPSSRTASKYSMES